MCGLWDMRTRVASEPFGTRTSACSTEQPNKCKIWLWIQQLVTNKCLLAATSEFPAQFVLCQFNSLVQSPTGVLCRYLYVFRVQPFNKCLMCSQSSCVEDVYFHPSTVKAQVWVLPFWKTSLLNCSWTRRLHRVHVKRQWQQHIVQTAWPDLILLGCK